MRPNSSDSKTLSFFQGRGTAFTNWDSVYVGTGSNPREALEDALDGAGMDEWNVDGIETAHVPDHPTLEDYIGELQREQGIDPEEDDGDWDIYYYAAVYLKGDGRPIGEAEEGKPESAKAWILRQKGETPEPFRRVKTWRKWQGDPSLLTNKAAAGMRNTELRKYTNLGDRFGHAVRYHRTDVVQWDREGCVHVNNGGWRTLTTRERINRFMPHSWHIYQQSYQWYWMNRSAWNWHDRNRGKVVSPAIFGNNRPNKILFNNGDFVDRQGNLHVYNDRLVITPDFKIVSQPGVQAPPPDAGQPVQEGKYQKELDWLLRARKKHDRMREVKRLQKDVEEVDKVQPVGKRPKKRLNIH
jgi:hypothetical protein